MNIYDIAKEAGVSIATVSRVLNNKGTVSAATRARVEAILKQNNYTPSAIARGMVSKSMRTVAVLTVDIRVPHYAAPPIPLSGSSAAVGMRSSFATQAVTGQKRCATCRPSTRSRWTASCWSARCLTRSVRAPRWKSC